MSFIKVEVFSDLGRRSNICYYYKGNLDDLLKIRVDNPAVAGGPECSFKERCEWSILNSEEPEYFCTVVVNSSKIGKGNALFDGKETKTDAESLKPYIK